MKTPTKKKITETKKKKKIRETIEEERKRLAAAYEMSVLRKLFPRGSTVYLVLRSHSRSNMAREIGVVKFARSGGIIHPNAHVSDLLGLRLNRGGDGVRVSGAGMDLGFWLVSQIARKLYNDSHALTHYWI